MYKFLNLVLYEFKLFDYDKSVTNTIKSLVLKVMVILFTKNF